LGVETSRWLDIHQGMFFILGGDGKEYGPVSVAKIQEWVDGGRANQQTQARRANDTEWRTLGDFPEFGAQALAVTTTPVVSTTPMVSTAPAISAVAPESAPALPRTFRATRELGGIGRRLAAAMVDGFLQLLCKLPMVFVFFEIFRIVAENPDEARPEQFTPLMMTAYAQILPWLGLLVITQIVLLCVRSQTIGKLLLGLQIVDIVNEQPGGPVRAFLLRAFIPTLIELIPILGLLFWIVDSCFIFREDRRCIHDLIAGTKVVRM
jgi:uncharacterized RDD family membrane protein YckC